MLETQIAALPSPALHALDPVLVVQQPGLHCLFQVPLLDGPRCLSWTLRPSMTDTWAICSMLIGITVIIGAIALYRAISVAVVEADEPAVGPAGRGGDAGTQGRGGPGGNSNQNFDTTSTTQLFDTFFKIAHAPFRQD